MPCHASGTARRGARGPHPPHLDDATDDAPRPRHDQQEGGRELHEVVHNCRGFLKPQRQAHVQPPRHRAWHGLRFCRVQGAGCTAKQPQYSTPQVQHSTAQVQHGTAHHSTVQHSTAQHNTSPALSSIAQVQYSTSPAQHGTHGKAQHKYSTAQCSTAHDIHRDRGAQQQQEWCAQGGGGGGQAQAYVCIHAHAREGAWHEGVRWKNSGSVTCSVCGCVHVYTAPSAHAYGWGGGAHPP